MSQPQPGILAPLPPLARYLTFVARPDGDPGAALAALAALVDGESTVAGLGASLVAAVGGRIEGLQGFPRHSGAGFEVPATGGALWCWLRGTDRGELLHRGRALERAVAPGLQLEQALDAFLYADGHDLTGYEDGTENPEGEAAAAAALASGRGPGLDGSSFVAVQQWQHDLDHFAALPQAEQDHVIGRRRSDNQELADAPPSAHVKRTAQESFTPQAFVLRRSMPWAEGPRAGLVFTAFGHSCAAFEALLQRMAGVEDGIADALFRFTRPLTGAYFWCPPLRDGRLDLSALGR
ncbi:MAG TPA: Dyp-type peroxidase [Gammaproteobacteria bacterium]